MCHLLFSGTDSSEITCRKAVCRRENSVNGQSYLQATLPVLDVTVELNEKILVV